MIGGNTELKLESKSSTTNAIGEKVAEWKPYMTLTGYLDLNQGDSRYDVYNAKIKDSSHVFISDYEKIEKSETELRGIINGQMYDVGYIDNPMGLNKQLEIFLSYTGE
ncbi:MAG: phage head completion protein [Anaerovoracaceae bacterium]